MVSISISYIVLYIGLFLLIISVYYALFFQKEIIINTAPVKNVDNNNKKGLNAVIRINCENKPLSEREQKIIADIVLNYTQIVNGNYSFPKKLHKDYDPFKDEIVKKENSSLPKTETKTSVIQHDNETKVDVAVSDEDLDSLV